MTVTDIIRKPDSPKIIRLAAYCRVSSKSADQLHSFAAQIRYYKDYEHKNPQYKLVDVYADGDVKIGLNQASLNSKAGADLVLFLIAQYGRRKFEPETHH